MKLKGSDILAFWADWPPGEDWYYDDGLEIEDESGVRIDASSSYDSNDFGSIIWQGKGSPPRDGVGRGEEYVDFTTWLKKWLKGRTHFELVVTVPKDQEEVFREACRAGGWRIR